MTRKGEKRVSSTPALNQSEVEEWTGQSPSAESWLVPQQQGSISERDKRAQNEKREIKLVLWHTTCWVDPRSSKHTFNRISDMFFLYQIKLELASEMDEGICLECMDAQNLKSVMKWGVMLRLRGWYGLNCVTPKSLSVVSTEREGERGPSGRKHDLHVCRKWPCWWGKWVNR